MRKIVIVGGLLIICVIFFTCILSTWSTIYDTPIAPPGQFPLDQQPQVRWPGVVHSYPYRPMRGSQDNTVSFSPLLPPQLCMKN